jgi:hypothetical protein
VCDFTTGGIYLIISCIRASCFESDAKAAVYKSMYSVTKCGFDNCKDIPLKFLLKDSLNGENIYSIIFFL